MKTQQILNLPEKLSAKQPIVLFDGECTLCSHSVQFLLRNNRSGNLNFTSLQSETGSEIVKLAGKTYSQADTLLLLQDNKIYGYSTAALKITAHLGLPWSLTRVFLIVPPIIRDTLYQFVAKNRYKWFGRESFCTIEEKGYQKRFLY